jgi:hypothetical protein
MSGKWKENNETGFQENQMVEFLYGFAFSVWISILLIITIDLIFGTRVILPGTAKELIGKMK